LQIPESDFYVSPFRLSSPEIVAQSAGLRYIKDSFDKSDGIRDENNAEFFRLFGKNQPASDQKNWKAITEARYRCPHE